MKKALPLASLLLLGACANKSQVLVYPLATSESYLQQSLAALRQDGFKAQVRQGTAPSDLDSTALVYGPGEASRQDAVRLQALLQHLGQQQVQLIPQRLDNYLFTPGHLGLYLFEPGRTLDRSQAALGTTDGSNQYHNEGCGRGDMTLILNDNGRYRFVRESWDEQKGDYVEEQADGDWQQEADKLSLSSQEGSAIFVMRHELVSEGGSRFHLVRLQRQGGSSQALFDGCSLVMRLRMGG
ncbi:hypothetical protein PVT67_15735 [Gallaecimonas kandeliae]|uniref:hypothetical protein n=1 Tax=Gallaecimonas kandeliae TaxID=3029055 RepID=UPI002648F0FD|nr:hypothetical protein [Gallaecimonas kandeliae]WKE65094.1 hypothetical protein PVT67_15735 [Gallaecimonas kandeliae]